MKRMMTIAAIAVLAAGCSDVRDKENAMREFVQLCEVPIRAELELSSHSSTVKMMCDRMRPVKK